ncbi:ParB/RepB/Spo0J family partition protein [Parabacteroides sp.]
METTVNNIQQISLANIQTSTFINQRKKFSEKELSELADSIKKNGILQAILLRPTADGYEIVFGERRYKASLLAGLNTIPAIVREISDDEALEIAWVENVKRQDITPIEEAEFYQKLLQIGRYDIPSLCTQLGKSEGYIRIRLKLNSLIAEFKGLLDDEEIKVSTAFEIAKYTEAQQVEIFDKHYNVNGGFQDWRSLTTKETISRLENAFTQKLDIYTFDKSECYSCPNNTNNQSLFPIEGECGNCSNLACLRAKNTSYLVNRTKQIISSNPQLTIARERYNYDEAATSQLQADGHTIEETEYLPQYPIPPVQPIKSDYDNEDDFNADTEEYYANYTDYESSAKELNELYEQGKLKMYACIGNNNIALKYKKLSKPTDPIKEKLTVLEEKDSRNKEIAVEKSIADLKKEIEEVDLTATDFSVSEDTMLYFFMLSSLDKKYFSKFGISDKQYSLTEDQKLSIISSLTEEEKNLIRREYLIRGFKECFGSSVKSNLFIEFAKQHIPDKLVNIQNKYNDEYLKRSQKLEEKKNSLVSPASKPAKEKAKMKRA